MKPESTEATVYFVGPVPSPRWDGKCNLCGATEGNSREQPSAAVPRRERGKILHGMQATMRQETQQCPCSLRRKSYSQAAS
jgi:hypothetical protein